jgi:metal-responsive CopG/Arc/MetJ family transcriptional regulator
MATKRLNVTLPEDVVKTLNEFAGPRSQSAFIAESVRYFAKRKKQQALARRLVEGYQATANEDLEITKSFEDVDFEDWNDD